MGGYRVTHEQFSGPLDLLLSLIEREEMEITNISLTKVTDDFFAYLDTHQELPAYELADFLVVAARLMFIKSRAILPSVFMASQEEEVGDLASQLRMYKAFVEASKKIEERLGQKRWSFAREPIVVKREQGFYPPATISVDLLHRAFVSVIEKLKPLIKLPETAIKRVVSIKERIETIREFLRTAGKASFKSMIHGAKDRTDVIVSFLALLELVKQRELTVDQPDLFGDIELGAR